MDDLGILQSIARCAILAARKLRLPLECLLVLRYLLFGKSPINRFLIRKAAKELPLAELDLLIIENVGNLVCPAAFDLGESLKLAVLSAPEGDEKPLKYPALFKNAQLTVITKCELADVCRFDIARATANIHAVNPNAAVIALSVFEGTGMDAYYDFLLGIMA